MKARFLIPFAILPLLTLSCAVDSDDMSICSVEDPVSELDWLAEEIDEMATSGMSQYQYVTRAIYGSATVFIFRNCCPNCGTVTPVYSCSGVHLGNIGTGKEDISASSLYNDLLVWKPENSSCNLK